MKNPRRTGESPRVGDFLRSRRDVLPRRHGRDRIQRKPPRGVLLRQFCVQKGSRRHEKRAWRRGAVFPSVRRFRFFPHKKPEARLAGGPSRLRAGGGSGGLRRRAEPGSRLFCLHAARLGHAAHGAVRHGGEQRRLYRNYGAGSARRLAELDGAAAARFHAEAPLSASGPAGALRADNRFFARNLGLLGDAEVMAALRTGLVLFRGGAVRGAGGAAKAGCGG